MKGSNMDPEYIVGYGSDMYCKTSKMQFENIIEKIKSQQDIKELNTIELEALALDIRKILVKTTAKTGGHLSSSLGVVELTIALHRIFNLPNDKIVWDVGHQTYAHKILTGRRDRFSSLRQKDGICGFPKSSESQFDAFVAGHSSTSISAALGIAKANEILGNTNKTIAVIGDGSLSGGMAYEGLNNAGRHKKNLIVVLNDNEMSISKNVGSMAKYLSAVRSKPEYFRTKDFIQNKMEKIPIIGKTIVAKIKRSKAMLKDAIYHSTFFEDMGFVYLGPVDGHNINQLENVFERAKTIEGPVFIHVQTKKGKGYKFAETNPDLFHGVSKFNIKTGEQTSKNSFSNVFGKSLMSLAKNDKRICAVTAAMTQGTGLQNFALAYPERFFDVGIAEEHATTFCAGMASQGIIPIFAVYSTFLQRGYDQIIHDCAIENQHVIFAVDRAGIVGEDGETHQGLFDVSFLSSVPGMTIYSPSNFQELEYCLKQAIYMVHGVVAVRYPRGSEIAIEDNSICEADFSHTKYADNSDNLLISYGRIAANAVYVAKTLSSAGTKTDFLKLEKIYPIHDETIEIALSYKNIFFVEETIKNGSIGEHFLEKLAKNHYKGEFNHSAVDNCFVKHQSVAEALSQFGFDVDGIKSFVTNSDTSKESK